jgi:hypothetical protein
MDNALLSQIESMLGLDRRRKPAAQLIDAACWAIPKPLAELARDPYLPCCGATNVVATHTLEHAVRSETLSAPAIRWAIYRLIELRYLDAEIAALKVPSSDATMVNDESSIQDAGSNDKINVSGTVNAYHVPESTRPGHAVNEEPLLGSGSSTVIQYLVVWPTESLFLWSNNLRGAFLEHVAEDAGFITWPLGRQMMRGKSWKLLSCLWGQRDVTIAQVSNSVWDQERKPHSTIRSQVCRLNEELAGHDLNVGWEVTKTTVDLLGSHNV